ncbi:MAG TPA: cob(I)yrinic acid a,c-diamide adenosyltransferase, partial [Planctomycetota bacterium]|nr:cob(I)yrinic acid a,c-diamide adenosyltransferase [Planctomycetota bacterium]
YTGTGDEGDTGLFGNRRVSKDDVRIEAYGTIDEVNAFLGLLRANVQDPQFDRQLKAIQDALFEVGADLATEGGQQSLKRIEPAITELEGWIDASEAKLPQLRSFVLPGGCTTAALLHVLRTVTRRAERRYWTLERQCAAGPDQCKVPRAIGIYLNRLSDLFFSWARRANQAAGVEDVPWTRA